MAFRQGQIIMEQLGMPIYALEQLVARVKCLIFPKRLHKNVFLIFEYILYIYAFFVSLKYTFKKINAHKQK